MVHFFSDATGINVIRFAARCDQTRRNLAWLERTDVPIGTAWENAASLVHLSNLDSGALSRDDESHRL